MSKSFWEESSKEKPEAAQERLAGKRNGSDQTAEQHPIPDDPRPEIRVIPGEVDQIATRTEAALIEAGLPLFQRGPVMVRPVVQEVPASGGRTTLSAGFREITKSCMIDLMAQAIVWTKYNRRAKAFLHCDPPGLVADIVLSRSGYWRVPAVAGVITTPTLRPDGSILSAPGYDASTRLYHVADPDLAISILPGDPTDQEARTALELLDSLLDEFPFVADVDRSVALSALITPVIRGACPVVPMHAIVASTAGTGKSYLADLASSIATGRPCPAIAMSARPDETESRLVGLLLAAFPIISIDNVNGDLSGDLLCQAIERPLVRVRRLGSSDIYEIESRSSIFATGNNLRVRGDMTRRSLVCTLDALVERPELRQFKAHPVDTVLADRGTYVTACLTVVRAFIASHRNLDLAPFASFGEWSKIVRGALVWLGREDPVSSVETARDDDPELSELREFVNLVSGIAQLTGGFTSRQLVDVANDRWKDEFQNLADFVFPDLRDCLMRIAGQRGAINPQIIGKWLFARKGRIISGLRIKRVIEDKHANVPTWQVVPGSAKP